MRPASVGVAPRASCMYWLRKTEAPNIAMPVAIDAITESVKVRLRNRPSGMSGSLTRSSTITDEQEQQDGAADHEDGLGRATTRRRRRRG